jgi:membrane fusion protein (multidrug efflux system)
MAQRLEGEAADELLEEQQRLRDEVQRLRDEQQRLRDEQQKQRDEPASTNGAQETVAPGQPAAAQKPPEQKPEDQQPKKKRRISPVTLIVLVVILAAAVIGGILFWQYLSSYESTDDAQIDGHINSISSRINGTVASVYVQDNQPVKAGQVLVDLDPKDYMVALDQAKAALAQSQAEIKAANPNIPITLFTNQTTISTTNLDIAASEARVSATEQSYQAALADVREAAATHVNDLAEVARFKVLVDKDEVSREQYEAKVTAAKASEATVQSKQAAADSAQKQINQAVAELNQARARAAQAQQNAPRQLAIQHATVETRQAEAMKNKAAVDQALLNLQYTKIMAPVNGVVGKKSVEPGVRISPGQDLMAVVPLDDIWVTANFKETQLRSMREGQRATIKVDAFSREYGGYVESIAGASGAKYSLLPSENATGNYVKVVQRIPVRIRINKGQNDDRRLRPGMSVEPKVWLQ